MCFLDSRVFVLGSCWLVKEGRSAAARDEALDFRELSAGVPGVVRRGLSILTLSLSSEGGGAASQEGNAEAPLRSGTNP